MHNYPAATNPAATPRCHAERSKRRFVDRNRWTSGTCEHA